MEEINNILENKFHLELRGAEERLFSKWKKDNPNLCKDGLANEIEYSKSVYKILYVLKEVNNPGFIVEANKKDRFDLRYFIKNGGRSITWNMIALWTYAIHNLDKDHKVSDLKALCNEGFRKENLNKIAAINLKKAPGGAKSINSEIIEASIKDKEYLKEQIKIYNPDIIICCGKPTGKMVKDLGLVTNFKNWSKSELNGLEYHISSENKLIIHHCHPQALGISSKDKFYPLIKAIKDLKNRKVWN